MPFANTFKKIRALEQFDLVKEIEEILIENSETIINLVRGQMAVKGKTGLGNPIKGKYGPFYSHRTTREKERYGLGLGKLTSHVTMFYTGDFYSSMYLKIEGTKFSILSPVEYFGKINAWNDNSLVELDAETLLFVRNEILMPQLQIRFKAKTNV